MSIFKQLFNIRSASNEKQEGSSNLTPLGDGDMNDGGASGVKLLEIKSRKLTNQLFTGEYHTAFKGVGMVFKEIKQYSAGDDIRFIDWNVSARMGTTYSKVFEEERELLVFLVVDASASTLFGTGNQSKKEMITEIAAVLSFSAANNNDKTGLILCTDRVEKYIPPKKGKDHVLYMIRLLLGHQPKALKTDLSKALRYLNSNSKHKSIVFILSDFATDDYEHMLRISAKKHDVIGIRVYDKAETMLPKVGLMQVTDAETGETIWIDTHNVNARAEWQRQYDKITVTTQQYFKKAGADLLQIATGEDYAKVLQKFFIGRGGRKS